MAVNKIKIRGPLGPKPPVLTGAKLTLAGIMRTAAGAQKKTTTKK